MRTVGKALMLILALALIATPAMAAKSIKLHHLNQDDPFDNPTGAMATVFKSLVEAGTNGGITVQTNNAFKNSGLFHILSISGVHMAIVGGFTREGKTVIIASHDSVVCGYPGVDRVVAMRDGRLEGPAG